MDFSFVERITERYMKEGYFPSASVAVFTKEAIVYEKGFGDNPVPGSSLRKSVDADTVYDMASCTKIATSTQILELIDEGKITLSTTAPEVLSEIVSHPALYERLKTVTIYQLLTHTSGIIDWYPFYVQRGRDFYDVFDSFIADTKIESSMVYSDMNFMLLGKMVEVLRDCPLKDCQDRLRDRIHADVMEYCFVGDDRASSCYGNPIEETMVAERGLSFDGWRDKTTPTIGVNDGNAHYFFEDVAGHAGIQSTARSYARLGQYYLNSNKPILQEAMKTQTADRGLGLQTGPKLYPGGGCGHTGFSGTWFWFCKEKGLGAVALTNSLCYPEKNPHAVSDYRHELSHAIYNNFI